LCKEGTVSKTTPGGGRERERERERETEREAGRAGGEMMLKKVQVCDGEIETEREGGIVLKAETGNSKYSEREKERERRGEKEMTIKRVIARHRGKHLFKFPPEVSHGCKCCGRLLRGKTPWVPYLKGTFRSTILICPSIPTENNFKDSSHFHANRPTPE